MHESFLLKPFATWIQPNKEQYQLYKYKIANESNNYFT